MEPSKIGTGISCDITINTICSYMVIYVKVTFKHVQIWGIPLPRQEIISKEWDCPSPCHDLAWKKNANE